MQLKPKQIAECLNRASAKKQAYLYTKHKLDAAYLSVNSLLKNLKESDGVDIELSFYDDGKPHHFHSFVKNCGNKEYKICIIKFVDTTNCWQRYALCKELFHIILDSEESRSIDLAGNLRDFSMSMKNRDEAGNKASTNEVLAEMAAMEFLFPYHKRVEYAEEINASSEDKDIYIRIATDYRIPRVLVEEYLNSDMMQMFEFISWQGKSGKY